MRNACRGAYLRMLHPAWAGCTRKETIMRRTLAAFLLASVVGAITMSSAAFAGEWDVNGTKLVGTAALSGTALTLSIAKFVVDGVLSIECSGETIGISGGELSSPDIILAAGITLNECALAEPTHCTIKNGTIRILAVHGLATLDGPSNTFIKLLPQKGTFFASIPFEGELCAFKEEVDLAGSVDLLLDNSTTTQTTHPALVSTLKGQLAIFSSEMLLTGSTFDLKLASNQTWSFL